MTIPEIIDQIQELILEDCRISAKSIAEQLGISRDRVGSIIHEDLDMWQLSAKWVPKCLNAGQKCQRCQSSEQIMDFFSARSKWFPVAIGDHGRNLVIPLWPWDRATINWWRYSGSTRPKIFREKKSAGNILASICWDQDDILPIDYLPKGQNINAEYYSSLLVQLKDILKEKRRGNVTKVVLFLHGNARAHRALATQKKLDYVGFQYLNQSPYSSNPDPSDYNLFPGLKNNIKVAIFLPTRR